jgi:hypothetical protein
MNGSHSQRTNTAILLPLCMALAAPAAWAQEAIQTDAATQPSVGSFVLRQQIRFTSLKNDPALHENIQSEWESRTSLSYGITPTLSITASLPLLLRERRVGPETPPERETTTFGVGDIPVMLKYRIFHRDTSPVDTTRFSLMAGAELPSFDRPFSSESVDPIVGAVLTAIRGRHGFNQAVQYKFNTGGAVHSHPHDRRYGMMPGDGPDDALFYDSAYLFRVDPAVYTAGTHAATYAVLELNGVYETNGDNEILLSPGLLYEARTWAGEISVQFPIVQDVDRRPEVRYSVVAGLRFLF